MTQKAYKKGDPCPPLAPGVLRLYSMRTCPYAERTRLVLSYHNIPHEVVNIGVHHAVKPDWMFEKNPLGLVPFLEQDGKIIYESPICNEYLDDVYGHSKLYSTDPYERAKKRMLIERFGKIAYPLHIMIVPTSTEEEKKKAAEDVNKGLETFEKLLTTKYFGGDEPDAVDLYLWPNFERMPMVHELSGIDPLPADRFPKLTAWADTMKQLPVIKATIIDTKTHVAFRRGYENGGVPDFDIGLN